MNIAALSELSDVYFNEWFILRTLMLVNNLTVGYTFAYHIFLGGSLGGKFLEL